MNDILNIEDHDYPGHRIVIPLTETPVQQPAAPAADGWPQLIRRIQAVKDELDAAKTELQQTKLAWANDCADHAAVQRELIAEREARANAQIRADAFAANITAMHAKCVEYRALLERVVEVDEACSGEAYAALISDVKSALEANPCE